MIILFNDNSVQGWLNLVLQMKTKIDVKRKHHAGLYHIGLYVIVPIAVENKCTFFCFIVNGGVMSR